MWHNFSVNTNDMLEKLKALKIPQEKIAREVGVSVFTVGRWKRGQFKPSIHVQEKLVKFLDRVA